MRIIYKCRCQEHDREVTVADRVPNSSVEDWMLMIGHCISYDHRAVAPNCHETKMTYVKIPYTGGEVGANARQ